MLQLQTILQYFYKMLMWSTSYWFSSKSTINITFSFTNNHSPHQQFVKFFVKQFISLTLFFKLQGSLALFKNTRLKCVYFFPLNFCLNLVMISLSRVWSCLFFFFFFSFYLSFNKSCSFLNSLFQQEKGKQFVDLLYLVFIS